MLAGDFNVVPSDFDIYNPRSWRKDALLQPQSRAAYQYFRNHWQRNAGLRIDHFLLSAALAPRLLDSGVHTWVRGETHG